MSRSAKALRRRAPASRAVPFAQRVDCGGCGSRLEFRLWFVCMGSHAGVGPNRDVSRLVFASPLCCCLCLTSCIVWCVLSMLAAERGCALRGGDDGVVAAW